METIEKTTQIPIFKATINENILEDGVNEIALVDYPAVEVNWVKLSKNKKNQSFAKNKDERIITGPIMIADKPIYRHDNFLGEYYILYEKDTIKKMCQKFLIENKQNKINEMHSMDHPNDIFMVECWIIEDPENDKSKILGFKDLTPGTWMLSYYIKNEDYWNKMIKSGNFKGFSLEGFFGLEFNKKEQVDEIKQINDILNDDNIEEEDALDKLKQFLN